MTEKELNVLPAQRELLESREPITLFVGGYGAGKTRALAYKSILLGLENAPCIGIWVEPTYTMIRDVAVPTLKEVLAELEIPYKYGANDHVLTVADTYTLLLRSGDRPELLVGINASHALLDEPALQSEDVPKALLSRLRDPRAKLKQLVCAGTPEGASGWFYDWAQRDDVHVIRAKTTDNPFLGEDYVQQLEARLTPEEVRAYILGEFCSFEGSWYRTMPKVTGYDDLQGIKVFLRPDQTSGQLVLGVDTGGGVDRDACSLALVDKRDRRLVASWKDATATIDHMADKAKLLVEHYTAKTPPEFPGVYGVRKGSPPAVIIEKNGIGQATYQQFMAKGIMCQTVNTTEASRYAGLLACRNAVSEGFLFGPEELAEEARLLVVKAGKFDGPKDLSMSIGFCYNHIAAHPYIAPAKERPKEIADLASRLGKKRGW